MAWKYVNNAVNKVRIRFRSWTVLLVFRRMLGMPNQFLKRSDIIHCEWFLLLDMEDL